MENDFLNVGSMGHASSVALGIAMAKPDRKTVVGSVATPDLSAGYSAVRTADQREKVVIRELLRHHEEMLSFGLLHQLPDVIFNYVCRKVVTIQADKSTGRLIHIERMGVPISGIQDTAATERVDDAPSVLRRSHVSQNECH